MISCGQSIIRVFDFIIISGNGSNSMARKFAVLTIPFEISVVPSSGSRKGLRLKLILGVRIVNPVVNQIEARMYCDCNCFNRVVSPQLLSVRSIRFYRFWRHRLLGLDA